MPFDVLPQETKTKVGRFQHLADAMLRGCALTKPTVGVVPCGFADERISHACAWMAMKVGFGYRYIDDHDKIERGFRDAPAMRCAYSESHGTDYVHDFISGLLTREQIAARIAAL